MRVTVKVVREQEFTYNVCSEDKAVIAKAAVEKALGEADHIGLQIIESTTRMSCVSVEIT